RPGHTLVWRLTWGRGVTDVVNNPDIAKESWRLCGDIGVPPFHIEPMHSNTAGAVMHELLGASWLRDVVDLEAAIVIGALCLLLNLVDIGFRHTQLLCQLRFGRRAPQRIGELIAHTRQFV